MERAFLSTLLLSAIVSEIPGKEREDDRSAANFADVMTLTQLVSSETRRGFQPICRNFRCCSLYRLYQTNARQSYGTQTVQHPFYIDVNTGIVLLVHVL